MLDHLLVGTVLQVFYVLVRYTFSKIIINAKSLVFCWESLLVIVNTCGYVLLIFQVLLNLVVRVSPQYLVLFMDVEIVVELSKEAFLSTQLSPQVYTEPAVTMPHDVSI